MKVLFVAAEASPFVKVGGLGDVIGGLPAALNENGVDARVVLPLYSSIDRNKYNIRFVKYIYVSLGWKHIYCGIFEAEHKGIKFYFIDNEQYFNRYQTYGELDDGERFAFFSKAAVDMMPHIDFKADVMNANDWHAALSVVYLDRYKRERNDFYKDMKSVISIHNVEFQGKFNPYLLGSLFGLGNDYLGALKFDHDINLLKGAIQLADRVNTVSENYANELLNPYFSFGLDPILSSERGKLRGIVNGIDYDKFDPSSDPNISQKFSLKSLNKKIKNKLAFQKEMALEVSEDIPMVGMVTRLTGQKGIDLVVGAAEHILNMGAQLVILGTGDPYFEDQLRNLENRRHDKMRSILKFSNEISSKIYASSDIFLMPSKSEPCGLSQLIAMRYGSIPVVNRVGGLRDTVEPFDPTRMTGYGFTFESYNMYDMLDAIKRALDVYNLDQKTWKKIMKNAMDHDMSWNNSAKKYIEMYNEIV